MADAAEWRLYASKEICMCGSRVDAHGMGDGHSPVSEWDYYAWQEEEAMTQHTGLPVAGYKPQSDEKVQAVNGFKQDEERILRKLDALKDTALIDGRWLAIGRTQLEQAFMAINRAVFQPGRVELPEDTDVSVARGTNPDGSDFVPTELPVVGYKPQSDVKILRAVEVEPVDTSRPIYRSARLNNLWCYVDGDVILSEHELRAYEMAGRRL